MLAVFKVEEWDNYGLLVVDSALIYSVVDVLLGGRRGTAAMRIEGRPYTTIERTLVERLITVVLQDLSDAFSPLSPAHFRFERLEVNPRFAAVSRLSNACILSRLRVDMEDRGGKIELLLPYATLEPVRELLLQQFMGEKFGRDSIWETHLAEELRHTELALDVVLDEQAMPLAAIMSLQRGDRITLNVAPGAPVMLRCGEVPLFEAELGRRENRLAVRIGRELRQQPEGLSRWAGSNGRCNASSSCCWSRRCRWSSWAGTHPGRGAARPRGAGGQRRQPGRGDAAGRGRLDPAARRGRRRRAATGREAGGGRADARRPALPGGTRRGHGRPAGGRGAHRPAAGAGAGVRPRMRRRRRDRSQAERALLRALRMGR